jgi:ATP-binding cassette subfamily B protein
LEDPTPETDPARPDDPDLPEEARTVVSRHTRQGEIVQFAVTTDIRLDGTYGPAWLLATDRRLLAISPNGPAGPDTIDVPFERIASVDIDDHFGSGSVRVRTGQDGATMAYFSKSLAPRFARLSDEIEDLLARTRESGQDGKVVHTTLNTKGLRGRRCKQCGQVIPRWTEVCPACLDTRKLLVRLLSYARPYWRLGGLCLALLLAGTFIGLTPPLLMRELIDGVLAPASVRSRVDPGSLVPRGEQRTPAPVGRDLPFMRVSGPTGSLALLVCLLLVVNLSRSGIAAIRSYLMSRLGQTITLDLRHQVYRHLHRLSLSYYNERETGRIMASITQDVGRLQDFISDGLQEIIRDVATIAIICAILFSLNAWLAFFVLLPTPLLVVSTLHFGGRLQRVYRGLWGRWAGISALLADTIPGVRVVKAFAQENREIGKFEHRSRDLWSGEIRVARIRSVFTPVMTFITSLGTLIIWWSGGNRVLGGDLSLGDFTAFTAYMWQFYGPVESMCHLNHRFQRAATSAERVFEVLDTSPDVADRPGAVVLPPIDGRVEFRDITFGYEAGKPILKDLSFVVEPGEMIGLAGHSGAGKSTLINLICRFYEPESGAVFVDGEDIRDVTLKSLRDQIGVVLQDPFLFNGTVADNIAYGKPEAGMDEIIAAARAANAHDFILGFPEGYDTVVGERGTRVSGGERQRISIARAILREPRILILDEATASVDTETEAQIQEALARLVRGRTTFAIAHRLSTLKNASRLLILEKGRLAEIGTHDELLEKDGIYAKLCRMQTELTRIRAV